MKRTLYAELVRWKNNKNRKPLLLQGARQVGKTWLMKEFGKNEYKNVVYVNFDDEPEVSGFFEQDLHPERIVKNLAARYKTNINPADTLIIFDEVQESARALNSLKYFDEDAPEYHIIAAGSFLGVATHGGFPVGKVNRLTLHPLSFYEFLDAIGENRYLETIKKKDFAVIQAMAQDYTRFIKTYFYVGGMPAAVAIYAENQDILEVRATQKEILDDYEDDFSKHISPINTAKVKAVWNSIPVHLAKEKKKFMYKGIKTGARAYAYEDAMNWLFDTRLVYKVSRILTAKLPLASYEERDAFKLYMLDIGLLCAKVELDIKTLLDPNYEIFSEFNGALTEQFVLQELQAIEKKTFYWGREKGAAEVDFVLQWQSEIVPVEVKAGIRKKSKSLNVYIAENHPAHAVRASLNNYGKAGNLYSIPLYMIASLEGLLNS